MLPLHTDQPPQIYDGYQSVSPLPLDFLDRQPIYQLYTLLNRAILFGDSIWLWRRKRWIDYWRPNDVPCCLSGLPFRNVAGPIEWHLQKAQQ